MMITTYRKYDDGAGPYTFCKRGLSWCDDQQCECVDSAQYRALYYSAREYRGWTSSHFPRHGYVTLALWAGAGALVGALVLVGLRMGGLTP